MGRKINQWPDDKPNAAHRGPRYFADTAKKWYLVGSKNVCGRLQRLIQNGTIFHDPRKVGLKETFFVSIRTSRHDAEWTEGYRRPEITEGRLAGTLDYLLKVQVFPPPMLLMFFTKPLCQRFQSMMYHPVFRMEEMKRSYGYQFDQEVYRKFL